MVRFVTILTSESTSLFSKGVRMHIAHPRRTLDLPAPKENKLEVQSITAL